jgi:hypothetical protein
LFSGIEQDGIVFRVVDQGSYAGIPVEAHTRDYFTVFEVETGQAARAAALPFIFLEMHEQDNARPRIHGRLGGTLAEVDGAAASVAHVSGHDRSIRKRREGKKADIPAVVKVAWCGILAPS